MFEHAVGLWQRLTGRQARAESAVAEDDRRVWVRYPADVEARCAAAGASEQGCLPARIRDISRGGIRVVADRRFEPGALLSVELPGAEGHPSITVLACVVYVNGMEEGGWTLGCNFARHLSEGELQLFGAARARPLPPDPRAWERFPCAVTASYHPALDGDCEKAPATVLNISASGVALLVDREVTVGTLLSAELHGEAGEAVLTILACVVHVTDHADGRWVLGCDFIRELTDQDLRTLRL